MKKLCVIIFMFMVSFGCSFSKDTKTANITDKVSEQEIGLIWMAYSSVNPRSKSRRKVEVEKCTQEIIDFYKRDAFYSKILGDFSACDFLLNDYTDSTCPSSRLVIKKCDTELKCKYEFSEVDLGTCE